MSNISTRKTPLTITSGQTTTNEAVDATGQTSWLMALPATFTGTSVSFQVSADNGATFQALYDSTGALVAVPAIVQGRSYDLPGELMGCTNFKVVSNAAEGGNRALVVSGKG